jgi:hypothetical protein
MAETPIAISLVAFLKPEAAYSIGFSHDWCTIAKIDQGLWKLGSKSALGEALATVSGRNGCAGCAPSLCTAPQIGRKCGSAHQDVRVRGELNSTRVGVLAAKHEQGGLLVWPVTRSYPDWETRFELAASMIRLLGCSDLSMYERNIQCTPRKI